MKLKTQFENLRESTGVQKVELSDEEVCIEFD